MGLKIGLFSSLLAKYGHSDYDGKAGYPRHGGKYPKDRAGRNLFEIYEDNGNKAIFWFQSAYDNAKNGEFENEIIGHAISFAGKESGILKTVHPHGMRFGQPSVLVAYFKRNGDFITLKIAEDTHYCNYEEIPIPKWWSQEKTALFIEERSDEIEKILDGNLYFKRKYAYKPYSERYPPPRCKHDRVLSTCMICDPKRALRARLRGRVSSAIRNGKKASTMELTGCNLDELKEYLGDRFLEGMSWENYGEWHIDHIRPCASFDLTSEEEQKMCFHFTNLQPMWAKENIQKSDKFDISTFNRVWDGEKWVDRPSFSG